MILIFLSCLLLIPNSPGSALCPRKIPQDFNQIVVQYGREIEEFDVVTDDGYILKLFHITGNESKQPVLLMHGLFDSADTFVIRGKSSLALSLAEAGYDVWVGNSRGNKYCRRHVKLSPDLDKKEFWDFSFHEMGTLDLPATIDFILEKTSKDQLSAIGHSQGNMILFILGSLKPEYNKKISILMALAPCVHLKHFPQYYTMTAMLWPLISAWYEGLGVEEVLPNRSALVELVKFICKQEMFGYEFCINVIGAIIGDDPEELEADFLNVALEHFPCGTSRKNVEHFYQILMGPFAQLDYGMIKNRRLYKTSSPPKYKIPNVTMPVALLVGNNDLQSTIPDVKRLKHELPNVVYYHVLDRLNHADFVWGRHMQDYIVPVVIDLLNKFS
ncbi:lipase 1-like [Ostrinia furnacalis]|uniref:lipase 1-like n=1 Tax=Ostrinia furnacalis TaxID=93504 RepID=UPI00103B2F24|nr:lipase 1-like [Ostrinia furnacalis]